MAKLIKGIFGPLSGRIGALVGSSWKGIPYMKMKNVKQPKTSRSPAQIASQEKFRFMKQWLSPFRVFINIGFRAKAHRCTEENMAFKINYHRALLGSYPNFSMDYSLALFSKGLLAPPLSPTVHFISPDTLQLKWLYSHLPNENFDDQLMLIVYAPLLHQTDGLIGGVNRSERQKEFKLHEAFRRQSLHVYMSFVSFKKTEVSDSVYLGEITS